MEPGLITYNQHVNECKCRTKQSRYLTPPTNPLVSPQVILGRYIMTQTDFGGSQFPDDEDRYGSSKRWVTCHSTTRCGLLFALQALLLPADSPTQLQTVQFPYLDTWGIRGSWGGYSPGYKLIVMLQQGTVVIV